MALSAAAYCERFLKIRTKDSRLVPFRMNEAQRRLYSVIKARHDAGKPVRVIVLKARQMGISTLAQALIFQDTATRRNVQSMVIAHREDSTLNLFGMSKLFYEELPAPLRPMIKSSSRHELIFENPDRKTRSRSPGLRSRIRCVTAGGHGVGRSDTLTNLHVSEYAFWEGDKKRTLAGLLQAVPNTPDSMVIIESTAGGYDDFKELWDLASAGENDFEPVFFPWYEAPEYRLEPPERVEWTREEKRMGLPPDRLWWRRWCIRNNCGGDERLFMQEYPASPREAFLTAGSGVFPNELLASVREPESERICFKYSYDGLRISDMRAEPGEGVKVFERPVPGRPYVIGADTAGEGSDWFAAQVIDNVTGRQAAVMRRRFDEAAFARELWCLGTYYNEALIGVEANYSTYPIRELERLGYRRQYVRRREDDFTGRPRTSYGFLTTAVTRPVMIANLREAVAREPDIVRDGDTVDEMLSFVYNSRRRPEAMAGKHDDLVMSLAIAHYIRDQQSARELKRPSRAEWTPDMREDYIKAAPYERELLKRKWGEPDL